MEAQADNSAGCSLPWGAPNPNLSHRGAPHHGGTIQAPPREWGMCPGWALGFAVSTLKLGRGCTCISPRLGDTWGHQALLPPLVSAVCWEVGREGREHGLRSIN